MILLVSKSVATDSEIKMPRFSKSNKDNTPVVNPEVNEEVITPDVYAEDANDITNDINLNPEETEMSENPSVIDTDDNNDDVSTEVNDETNETEEADESVNEVKPEDANPFIPVELIEGMKFKNPLAKAFVTQIVTFRNQAIDYNNMLAASQLDESESGIIAVAKSLGDAGNGDVFTKLNQYIDLKRNLDALFTELTTAVKADESLKIKSPEELTEIKNSANAIRTSIATSITGMNDYEKINPGESIKDAIDYIESLPPLPGAKSSSTKTSSTKGTGTSRPRLGKGGYIKVNGKAHESISKALNDLKKDSGKMNILAGDVLQAWMDAANVKTDWNDIPVLTEFSFKIGAADVVIKRTADTASVRNA